METVKGIYSEVSKFIADKIDSGEIIRVEWLTTELMERHNGIAGDDLAFYRTCTRAHLQNVVNKCIGKYDTEAKAQPEAQIVLAGFEHLQRAYTIERNGSNMLIPVDKCSDAELLRRAGEYEDMAIGCRRHAKELRSFVNNRAAEAA